MRHFAVAFLAIALTACDAPGDSARRLGADTLVADALLADTADWETDPECADNPL